MTIFELAALKKSGQFHHATYRNIATIWEGLYIYVKEDNKFNGYRLYGVFYKDDVNIHAAHQQIAQTGYSVGSYGRG